MSSCPKPASEKTPRFAADDTAYGGLKEWLTRNSPSGATSTPQPLFDSDDNAYGGLLEWLKGGISGRRVRKQQEEGQ